MFPTLAAITLSFVITLPPTGLLKPARVTCKQVSSCAEAVEIWCNGYGRADGNSDGIPCENVCDTVDEVDEIRSRIGC